MINKKFYVDKNLDYVTNLLKDRICLLEGQLIEKNSIIHFFVKHQMSPVDNTNCDNKI